nr:Protease inhibitor I8 domain containing protein [Haemonchus contortus]
MLNLVSLKRERFTGPLWLVTGTNGDVTGARSRKSMINGTTGDTVYYNISCHADADCPQGTTCMAPLCTPPPLPFECDKDGKCPRGLRCLQGFCTSLPWSPCGEGGACNHGTHCVKGTCVPSSSCPFPTIPKVKKGCQMETSLYLPSQCPKLIENCEPCPKNSAFQGCSNSCGPKTCSNLIAMSRCFSLRCGPPRCQCNYGYVQLSDNIQDGCVKLKDCLKAKSS